MRHSGGHALSTDFTDTLLRARTEGTAALQALAEAHLPLVAMVLRRFPASPATREDLYQQGVIGLMKALQRFDPARGIAFSTYAAALILGEMKMLHRLDAPLHISRTEAALQRQIRYTENELRCTLGREPNICELADALHMDAAELTLHMEGISVISADADSPEGTSLTECIPAPDDWQKRVELRDILNRLPESDRLLLLLRYRLGMTQTQAGQRLGMTQMQVSRRERIIRTLLKHALAE